MILVNNKRVKIVKEWLKTKHVYTSDSWLRDCIQHFITENERIPMDELKANVYEQWLLADLEQIHFPILPPQIMEDKYTLEGTFAVQMDYFYDISKPCYSQLSKLEGKEHDVKILEEKDEREFDGNRTMKLYLTDGCVYPSAIEYVPIKHLTPIYPPGTKILLKGPIECRLGYLFLKPELFSILGGGVEEKLKSHSRKNILRANLGLSKEIESEAQTNDDNPISQYNQDIASNQTRPHLISCSSQNSLRNSSENRTSSIESHQNSLESELMESFENDDFENHLDIEELEKIEKECSQRSDVPFETGQYNEEVPIYFNGENLGEIRTRKRIKFSQNSK